jgi:hypothetical protein
MVLFPIALIWLICVVIWLVRNSQNDGAPPPEPRDPRRWRPRTPRRPDGSRSRDSRSARVRG